MSRTRRLERSEVDEGQKLFQHLAGLLTRSASVLSDALDIGFPVSGGTAEKQRSNAVEKDDDGNTITVAADTVPERLAARPDREGLKARSIINRARLIFKLTDDLIADLSGWDPDRGIPRCPRCSEPLKAAGVACRKYYNGVLCGNEEQGPRRCSEPDCNREMPKGEPLRKGKCNKCRMANTRAAATAAARGSETIDVTDTAGMLTTEGNES